MQKIDLGGVTITLISGGALKLDGGAMFGIIPRVLWSRGTPPDAENRIQLACNCLLIETSGPTARRMIVEAGHGEKYDAKEQGMYGINPARWLLPSLAEIGVAAEDIGDVIVTHLHFDHAGGLTRREDERLIPTFPRARVHVQKREFDDARANFGIMTATYREENYQPIDIADRWSLHDGDGPIVGPVRALRTPGHTRGHQSIVIEGRDRTAIFAGDVMPTRAHVNAPYNMGYDLFPLDNRVSKQTVLSTLAAGDGLLVIDHEPATPITRVVTDRNWYRLEPFLAAC